MQKTPRATGMEKPIAKNITQLFLIVFSVVLGIFLSERIEEQKNKNEAAKLLSKVTSEVIENKKLVENWAPYHANNLVSDNRTAIGLGYAPFESDLHCCVKHPAF